MRSRSGLRLAHEGAHDSSQLRRAAQVTRSPASGVGVPVPGDAASRAAPIQPPLLLESAPLVLRLASAPRKSPSSARAPKRWSRRGGGGGIVFGGRMSLLLAVRGEDAKANTSDGGRAAATAGAITQTQSPGPRQPVTGSRSQL